MSETSEPTTSALLPRDELVALVASAHHGAPYAECKAAGAALADQSKLPRLFAENLGAGFGQWTFFPEPAEFVEFALGYEPPNDADAMWALARRWAEDDAAGRHTVLALVGRELLQLELKRVDVPELRAMFDERGARALELRRSLGLAMPPARARAAPREDEPAAAAPKPAAEKPAADKPAAESAPREPPKPKPKAKPHDYSKGPMKMPKPDLAREKPAVAPEAAPRRMTHPKFGEGVLERVDGTGDDAKMTVRFESGTKTLLARFLTEVPNADS